MSIGIYAYYEWPMELLRAPWNARVASEFFGPLFEFWPDGRIRVWVEGVFFEVRDPLL